MKNRNSKIPKSLALATGSWILFAIVAVINIWRPFDISSRLLPLVLYAVFLIPLVLAIVSLVVAIAELTSQRHRWPTVISVLMSLPLIVWYVYSILWPVIYDS